MLSVVTTPIHEHLDLRVNSERDIKIAFWALHSSLETLHLNSQA